VRRATSILFGALIAASLPASPVIAKDYGQVGTVFPVIETDLLRVIEQKLSTLQSSGQIDAMNQAFRSHAEAKVRRPTPVPGIERASTPRTWLFDPSIVIDHDIRDQKGNLIAPRGRRVNPLDFIVVKTPLVFINGDDPAQVAWALKRYDDKAKLIMVSGAPLEAMTTYQRRFFFDQDGRLTAKFGIHAVPAVVVQEGHAMRDNEIAKLVPGGKS
jgi:conjugal transfer pilus assembly protein TraW